MSLRTLFAAAVASFAIAASTTPQGRFEMNDLMVTAQGFTGTYQGPAGHIGGVITNGHISGARR